METNFGISKTCFIAVLYMTFFFYFHAKRKHLETFISFYIMCVKVIAYLELE